MASFGARKTPSRKGTEVAVGQAPSSEADNFVGSMADMPDDLRGQIRRLEDEFIVSTEKLKEITEHFVSELTRGRVLTFALI